MRKNKTIRTTLENGLTVVLREVHSAPIVSLWVWYRVGSRNETAGATGVSHWVEHMQFKGTAKYGPGEADRAVSRVGGVWNAMTAEDWTTYYETVPDGEIDLVLDLEADRMIGSLFLPEEVNSERTVILSEREGLENDPMFKLDDAVKRAAFDVHPYRNEIIGETADLNAMGRDDLYRYYRNHYAPNNAVLTMAGNFDADETLEKIRARFGPIPRAETEELCAKVLARIDAMFPKEKYPLLTCADVGTGSGAIAITLDKEEPRTKVWATDISKDALQVAKKNVLQNDAHVTLLAGDMLSPLVEQGVQLDVLVSNPPYIRQQETLEHTVVDYEPHVALFGGEDGLKFYRSIFQNCSRILKSHALMAFEMGWDQADAMKKLLHEELPNVSYEICKDMNGKDRILLVYWKAEKETGHDEG